MMTIWRANRLFRYMDKIDALRYLEDQRRRLEGTYDEHKVLKVMAYLKSL